MAKSLALVRAETALEEEKAKHQRDINAIFVALSEEAENRGWCYEYNSFVEGVIDELSVKPTDGVEREIELDILGQQFRVRALNEAAAIEKLHDFLSNSTYGGVLEVE